MVSIFEGRKSVVLFFEYLNFGLVRDKPKSARDTSGLSMLAILMYPCWEYLLIHVSTTYSDVSNNKGVLIALP